MCFNILSHILKDTWQHFNTTMIHLFMNEKEIIILMFSEKFSFNKWASANGGAGRLLHVFKQLFFYRSASPVGG